MIFSDHFFLFYFFPIFYSVYLVFHKKHTLSNSILIIGSIIFYASFGLQSLPVLLIPLVLDYGIALLIYKTNQNIAGRLLTIGTVIFNMGILGYFKYYQFLLTNLKFIFPHTNLHASLLTQIPTSIPLGLSFITFQRISYIIDIHRKKLKPEKNIISYAVYATLFPHLISGPIVRYSQVKKYLTTRQINKVSLFEGMKYFTFGFFIKSMIADNLYILVTHLRSLPGSISSLEAFLLIFMFSLRIYFDFSGYSLMAMGIAKFLGFTFPDNFLGPYQANSFKEFWQKWNITLSQWLRDYLYIPLGGNRHGKIRRDINTLITMLLGGLWHGANWNYIIWGGLHGVYQIIERHTANNRLYQSIPNPYKKIIVFIIVSLTWLTFQYSNPNDAMNLLVSLGHFTSINQTTYNPLIWNIPSILLAIYLAFYWNEEYLKKYYPSVKFSLLLVIMFCLAIVSTFTKESVPFIYFQF